ncbi:MAG: LamG-like jellyroll fold domain-containing protein [Verrucomicrobiota bacterium]
MITIPPGDIEAPGVPVCGEGDNYAFNTIFGPEFGLTLNIYGSLSFAWTIAPYSPDPAARSIINMFTNSSMSTDGASLNLGDGWWPIAEGCYVTMNMYDNAQYSSLGGAGWWWGGHLNIYDNASFFINGYVNFGDVSNPNWSQSDGTRSLVLGGGTLTLPEGSITDTNAGKVFDWVGRGMLRAYGKGEDTNDLIATDNTTNTIVTVVPLGGALERVYFQPLLKTNVPLGTFQQLVLVGDYPAVTGVYLSSSEPGLNPASFPKPVYTSSNPNAVTVNAVGVATAVAPGSATVSATVGAFTSTNTVTITVSDNPPSLIHRYSFTNSSGTNVADLVGGTNYTAQLVGGATLGGGQVTLDGSTGYVQLPAGILGGLDEVTIETWASFGSPINHFANLFCFGYADQTGANNGSGADYINVQLDYAGNPTTQLDFGQGIPGNTGERDAVANTALDGKTNVQVVAVYHPYAGYESLYINGALAATQTMFNNMSDPVAFAGPTYNSGSILAYTLGAQAIFDGAAGPTPNNYIGWDVYQGTNGLMLPGIAGADPSLNGSVAEFRIYSSPLTAAQIKADYALGPNQLIGANTHVTLTATLSGGNIVISWPTSSAYVTLVSSPVLGAGAVWTPVSSGTLAVVGANYQETIAITGSTQFFGLE